MLAKDYYFRRIILLESYCIWMKRCMIDNCTLETNVFHLKMGFLKFWVFYKVTCGFSVRTTTISYLKMYKYRVSQKSVISGVWWKIVPFFGIFFFGTPIAQKKSAKLFSLKMKSLEKQKCVYILPPFWPTLPTYDSPNRGRLGYLTSLGT